MTVLGTYYMKDYFNAHRYYLTKKKRQFACIIKLTFRRKKTNNGCNTK